MGEGVHLFSQSNELFYSSHHATLLNVFKFKNLCDISLYFCQICMCKDEFVFLNHLNIVKSYT